MPAANDTGRPGGTSAAGNTKVPAQAIGPLASADLVGQHTGATIRAALADLRLCKRPQGLVGLAGWVFGGRGHLGSGPPPKPPSELLKRVLSHFAYGESLAVRTRICCVVGGRPDSPKDLKGPLAAILR
jgi:hypothetical protein